MFDALFEKIHRRMDSRGQHPREIIRKGGRAFLLVPRDLLVDNSPEPIQSAVQHHCLVLIDDPFAVEICAELGTASPKLVPVHFPLIVEGQKTSHNRS